MDDEKTRLSKESSDQTTILRKHEGSTPEDNKPAADISDDATKILSNDDDATRILGNNNNNNDDDATRIISNSDNDATQILGGNADDDATRMMGDNQPDPSGADTIQKTGYMPVPDSDNEATQIQGDDTTGRTDGSWVPQVTMFGERENERSGPVDEGDTLNNRFFLEKKLGVGGMGVVYLARDKRKEEAQDRNPHVALKILGEDFKNHPQAFIALQREARKTQELAHPNIVTVYDFDRDGDNVYLTMEVLKGMPLDEEIKERGKENLRPTEEAITIIRSIAKGLAYAHQKNLVHSDLKPGNAFLAPDNEVKLLDFGIARACNIDKMEKAEGDQTIFDAGELGALTPTYASLEMLTGQEPHPSDDVYALGIMAWEVLTGTHPYNRKMAHEAMQEGYELQRPEGLSKQQWLAIQGALAFTREDRIQDAQEFLDIFDKASNKPLIAATSAILATVIAVGAGIMIKQPDTGPEIAFEALPVEVQQKVSSELKDARMSLKFNDYNSAIIHLDRANGLHERNLEVTELYQQILPEIEALLDQQPKAEALKQVSELMAYPSLKNNEILMEMKAKYGG